MTKQQAIDAVNAQCGTGKRFNKNSLAYTTAIAAIENPGTPQKCGKNTGSGNYASSKSWQAETAALLAFAGVLYHKENTSPRGGKAGDMITVFCH